MESTQRQLIDAENTAPVQKKSLCSPLLPHNMPTCGLETNRLKFAIYQPFLLLSIHGILIHVYKYKEGVSQRNASIVARAIIIYVTLSQSQPCTSPSGTVFSYKIKSAWHAELSREHCSAREKDECTSSDLQKIP